MTWNCTIEHKINVRKDTGCLTEMKAKVEKSFQKISKRIKIQVVFWTSYHDRQGKMKNESFVPCKDCMMTNSWCPVGIKKGQRRHLDQDCHHIKKEKKYGVKLPQEHKNIYS